MAAIVDTRASEAAMAVLLELHSGHVHVKPQVSLSAAWRTECGWKEKP